MGVVGIRSGVEVDWFRLPVVYRLGDGWVALYGVVLSWVVWWVSWWGDGLVVRLIPVGSLLPCSLLNRVMIR